MKKDDVLSVGLIIVIFIILFLLIIYTPIINKYRNNGDLIISEVMTANKYTILDSYGNSSDYIEIYNGNDYDINLDGYYLSDDNFNTKKWKFPSVNIKAKEYLTVYASGLDKYEDELHTNFKLDNNGEVVTLSDPKGKSLSKLYYLKSLDDTSYGYNGKDYVYYYYGTPNMANNGEYSKEPIKSEQIDMDIEITEYITNNISSFKSKDGHYYNVIELYNNEDYDINLENFYLSNSDSERYKYKFPNVTIKSKEYLVIYASGLNKYDEELHTNFKLDNKDNALVLSDKYKREITKLYLVKLNSNVSYGYFQNKWQYYNINSFGEANKDNYLKTQEFGKDLMINEVSIYPVEGIEIINLTDKNINLSNYAIGDKSGSKAKLPNMTLKPNGLYVVYGSDNYSYTKSKLYTGFHINGSTEKIYIYANDVVIDEYDVGKIVNYVSSGISNNKRVFYKNITLGSINDNNYYNGYSSTPIFSKDGGYIEKGQKITLSTIDDSTIYYTLDGSFPTNSSNKYSGAIQIDKTTVIKAISYKDGYLESDVISRTFVVGRTHDLAYVSISTNGSDLFSSKGLLVNYRADIEKKVSFEFYESDGTLGVNFIAGTKLTGMDSRERAQKSMAIYLRKEYGLQEVTYPFFKEGKTLTYSSFTLRNSGEDPFSIRIQDTVLTYALKDQMDVDMQDYRPVVVYLNGTYYGLYNMREKLNSDYVVSKYNINKDSFDLIKYSTAVNGNKNTYNNLVSYVNTHNPANNSVYKYLETQIDMQEFCNYLIVESYYGNTDLGNIRYWKSTNGKWRYMLYDLDWSLWNYKISMSYPVISAKVPAATYLYSTYVISRKLYSNSEFRDMYLSTLAYHLKNTFNPTRMSEIIDELAKEIETEMPYHISRWSSMYSSMSSWRSNVNGFKNKLTNRYNYVIKNLKSDFKLSNSEYQKYFGGIK